MKDLGFNPYRRWEPWRSVGLGGQVVTVVPSCGRCRKDSLGAKVAPWKILGYQAACAHLRMDVLCVGVCA